jgi:uncharacterized membrane protein
MDIRIQFKNRSLYLFLLTVSLALFFIAVGPGLFYNPSIPYISWQFIAFDLLCHQDPARSFIFNGSQMAVCSRCIGIYGAFLLGVMIMPFWGLIEKLKFRYYFRFLIGTIILNLIDVLGNLFEIWTNTNISRLFLGSLFGLSAAMLLGNEFFKKLTKED